MGTYYNTHIGCFLRIPVTMRPVTKTYLVTGAGKKTSARFDPNTGKENQSKTEIVNEKVYADLEIDDRADLEDDTFFKPQYCGGRGENEDLFIPNSTDDSLFNGDTAYDYIFSLEDINPEEEILKFKRRYLEYLNYYKGKYPNLEIHFGIVRYGM